ncbi:MAG: HAD-IA family hydrolase [Pseudomonadota bacterium]
MTMDAVLFDCDGVLVDSEVVGLEDSAEFLRDNGFSWGPDELIRRFTGKRDDRFRKELLEGYAEVLGRTPTEAEGETLFVGMIETRRASRHLMQPVPGARETLVMVSALGLKCAVASSSRQVHLDSKIERYGFSPLVSPHVYSAEHVAHGKPAPDIFLYAAERIGADPSVCVVIEDSPFGVEAGVNAGMQVWGFTGGGHCLEDHAERLVAAGAIRIHTSHTALQQELTLVTQEH